MKKLKRALIAAAVVSSVMLAGCGGQSDADLLSAAKAQLANRDPKAAVLQLNTLLQKNPASAEARFLLGTAFLVQGDAKSAAIELQKARDAKFHEDQVVPALARALLQQGQLKRVTDEFSAVDLALPEAIADLKTSLSAAYARQGQRVPADAAVAAALKAVPGFAPARVAQARADASRGNIDGALKTLGDVIAGGKFKADAYQLRGDILARSQGDTKAAVLDYRKVLAEAPDALLAHVGIITVDLAAGDLKAAQEQLKALQTVLPKHPQTLYTEAQVALAAKDLPKAREIIVLLLRTFSETAALRYFAGTVYLRGDELNLAESNFTKALQLDPDLAPARYLLAQTYMRLGQADKALRTLDPLVTVPSPIAETLSLAAEAQMEKGNVGEAEALLGRAAKAKPGNPAIGTARATAQLMRGQVEPALQALTAIAESDPGITADMALIGAQMRRREFDKALEAIERLERKRPKDPGSADLRARVFLLRKDFPSAKANFEKALKLRPSYFPATLGLTTLAIWEKKYDQARQLFEAALAADPKSAGARLGVVTMKMRLGADWADVEQQLKAGIAADPAHLPTRLALIKHYRPNIDRKAKLEAAQAAVTAIPNQPVLLQELGRVQGDSGDFQQAGRTFNSLIAVQPKAEAGYVLLADATAASGNLAGAAAAIRRGLDVLPESAVLRARLVTLSRNSKDFVSSQAAARAIQKSLPNSSAGYLLEGDVLAAQKLWSAAIAAYRKSADVPAPDRTAAPRVYTAMIEAGDRGAADGFAANWLKSHGKDADFRLFLGNRALVGGDNPFAERQFEDAIQIDASMAQALNNLAWLRATRNAPGAVGLAERAVALVPDRAAFFDTLAMAQAAEGAMDKAVAAQLQAIALAPELLPLQLNLAKLYARAGMRSEAAAQLDKLAAVGPKFASQADVARLKKELTN